MREYGTKNNFCSSNPEFFGEIDNLVTSLEELHIWFRKIVKLRDLKSVMELQNKIITIRKDLESSKEFA